jgi:hypothetical protein
LQNLQLNNYNASVVEWSITTDCKSVGFGLRWFESSPAHAFKNQLKLLLGLFLLRAPGSK